MTYVYVNLNIKTGEYFVSYSLHCFPLFACVVNAYNRSVEVRLSKNTYWFCLTQING